ncbi:ERF family protein [Gammaproteobacteria bacterium]|nr:ERF family protein [Gammaproteobacteria bacterium]
MTEEYKTCHESLRLIQQALNAPKNQYNKFGSYNYRSCESILEALKPLLPSGGTVTLTDDLVQIGNRYYVRASATFWIGNNAITTNAFARESETKKGMDLAQVTGAASSYARKFALGALFLIDDSVNVDDQQGSNESEELENASPVENQRTEPPPPDKLDWKTWVFPWTHPEHKGLTLSQIVLLSPENVEKMLSAIQDKIEKNPSLRMKLEPIADMILEFIGDNEQFFPLPESNTQEGEFAL